MHISLSNKKGGVLQLYKYTNGRALCTHLQSCPSNKRWEYHNNGI